MNKLERKSQSKKIFSIILHSTIISYYLIAQFIFKQKKKEIQRKNNNTPDQYIYFTNQKCNVQISSVDVKLI